MYISLFTHFFIFNHMSHFIMENITILLKKSLKLVYLLYYKIVCTLNRLIRLVTLVKSIGSVKPGKPG